MEEKGQAPRSAEACFTLPLSGRDLELVRWYLEDYLRWPQDPNPAIAARVERRMAALGEELFGHVFETKGAQRLWNRLQDRLSEARLEVVTDVEGANALPWELLRDPETSTHLALAARVFVRAHPGAARAPVLPRADGGPVRILLVICRPGAADDVPFRSVASRLVKGLGSAAVGLFDLDVLRPPTFEHLGRTLRQAQENGAPFHVVHFDGHGTWAEAEGAAGSGISKILFTRPREGKHGYLLFENPDLPDNLQLVDGPTLGALMHETRVPVLVLNACRSAHADTAEPPAPEGEAEATADGSTETPTDPHQRIRALGSLAQEVADAGAAGVVAMRYNVYVVTAARFVAELYAALARGRELGEAVTLGRKHLADDPLREVTFEPRALQDWSVPVVWEAAPLRLFPREREAGELRLSLSAGTASGAAGEAPLDPELPAAPDVGFFGRDETLLALDRAFDRQSVVLLTAYAGSGKTATAAEFARWYHLTGGVEGPVLFTSFELHKPLPRVLDRIGQVFGAALEQQGIHWLALDDAQRRGLALELLAQVPVLWIWDNVEPVAGFPAGTPSAWSEEEQREFAAFLRAARDTKAKFLLTSRRDERAWLGDLARRLPVPPMPFEERWQLAAALAGKVGKRKSDLAAWGPLLAFSGGNPLTLTVVAGQALRQGWLGEEQVAAFVDKLRAGEAAFDDQQAQGRELSLGASLAYGFEAAFTEAERKRLALLHLFQGFVDVDALRLMGDKESDWCLPEVRGLTRQEGVALLDRGAEVGLLTSMGRGYYRIHPALPWFFRELFLEVYRGQEMEAIRAWVMALSELGNFYHLNYERGAREAVGNLREEEANLLHARRLAQQHNWWKAVIGVMQGLRQFYNHTGRRTEWKRLVEEIAPEFTDSTTRGPLPGREGGWSLVVGYRVLLAQEERRWEEAEKLQGLRVQWDRGQAEPLLEQAPETLSDADRNVLRNLIISMEYQGHILRDQQKGECIAAYEEALGLAERIKDRAEGAVCALGLGHAYKELSTLRDLDKAEFWYRRSLELRAEGDHMGRAMCQGSLGSIAWFRFEEARAKGEALEVLLQYLSEAERLYKQSLQTRPGDDRMGIAVINNQLGMVYGAAGRPDFAVASFSRALATFEVIGDSYRCAMSRFNIAGALLQAGRLEDARDYAHAALRGFEAFGAGAAEVIQRTRGLIEEIEKAT